MVKGIDIFRERFRGFEKAFVLIGGAACDEWFNRRGLAFRATRDLDIVLVIEVLDAPFAAALRGFVEEGGYELRQRGDDGPPVLYRFAKPSDARFPHMLELFTRKPDLLELGDDQRIVPVPVGEKTPSLSAILLDNDYYDLIRNHSEPQSEIPFASATALIPLKARAWLDLTRRKAAGEPVDGDDIAKHRTDVFRLAATLAGNPPSPLPAPILADLTAFLAEFPENSPSWPAILAALKSTFGGSLTPAKLTGALRSHFRLSP